VIASFLQPLEGGVSLEDVVRELVAGGEQASPA
jgi:hypothetical protein